MITSLDIINFQSHADTQIDFDPGVNIFIGESDEGKSAILSAITLVATNKPLGNEWIKKGANSLAVDIELDSKHIISREKGKENLYVITDNDKPTEFRAFNKSVPEEVESLLNISDINIQDQFEGFFLLSKSPGEVAKYLNNAVRLDVIDKAQTNISKTLREENKLLLNAQSTIATKQDELEKYKWLPKAEGELQALTIAQQRIGVLTAAKREISGLIDQVHALTPILKESRVILKSEASIKALIKLDKDIENLNNTHNELGGLIDLIEESKKDLFVAAKLTEAEKEIKDLLMLQKQHIKLEQKYLDLDKFVDEMKSTRIKHSVSRLDAEKLTLQLKEAMPNICPLCEQEIK